MSASRSGPMWSGITPHAFGFDGVRWHTRAFCHEDGRFKDFVLSRCSESCGAGNAGAMQEDDADWNEHFEVQLIPNPQLSVAQQETVAFDYGMSKDGVRLSVRRALLFYFYKRLGLDNITFDAEPSRNPVVVKNRSGLDDVLGLSLNRGHTVGH